MSYMTVLVLGPNGSGKSVYAEKLTVKFSAGELYYVATMIPYGEEGKARVERHRKQRESMGFITTEKPFCVSELLFTPDASVLLEDVSNLLSNAIFGGDCNGSEDSVFADITAMCAKCRVAVLVSINALTPEPEYNAETVGYINALNRLNQRLSDFADTVVIMRDGTPVFKKGNVYDLD